MVQTACLCMIGRLKYMMMLKTFLLFAATALAEIVGCWLPYVWLRQQGSPWLLLPAAASVARFGYRNFVCRLLYGCAGNNSNSTVVVNDKVEP